MINSEINAQKLYTDKLHQ